VVLRGVRFDDNETDVLRGDGSTPLRRIGGGPATVGEKRERETDGEDEGEDSVVGLRERLAAAEADAAAAREETESWKKRHGELRAFVSEELVDRETKR
jgi:hypothetical protein